MPVLLQQMSTETLCEDLLHSWNASVLSDPKIHRHERSTGSSALCLGSSELERGEFPGLYEINSSLRCSLRSCKQVPFQWKVFNILLLLCHVPLLKLNSPTYQVLKTILQVWGGVKKTNMAAFRILALLLSVILESSVLQAWLSANNLQFVNELQECTCFYLYPSGQNLFFSGLISSTSF